MRRLTDVDRRGVSSSRAWRALRAASIAALACLISLAAAPRLLACTGDCDGDDAIAIQELIRGVNIALGTMDLKQCPEFDSSGDNQVTVDELISAVDSALNGCPVPLISTIVGTGVAGLNEDGLPPLQTYLYLPQDVTIGPAGLVYFADWNNHRIRRIKDGVVETVAGTGDLGDAHDGPSLETNFNHPTNVYFDHEGRMIIAAWHNSKVKRVDFTTGLIENLAGTGARSYGGDGGPANEAILDLPSSVVVDSNDNIIISDQANYRLRFLEPNGIISTICGTGEPGYSGDGGPAIDAQLDAPKGQSAAPAGRIDIDDRNRIYIADTGNHVVRMINEVGTITTIAGTGEAGYSGDGGPATQAQLNTPSDVAVAHNGTIYIADTMNNVVRHVKLDGTIETVAGTGERGFSGDGGPATEATLDRPYGLTVGPNGNVYVCDTHNQRIREITGTAGEIPPTPIPSPTPVIIPCSDEVGTRLHLRRHRADRLQRRRPRPPAHGPVLAVRHRVHPLRPPDRPRLEQPPRARDPARRHVHDDHGDGLRRRRPARLQRPDAGRRRSAHRQPQPPDRHEGALQRRPDADGVAQPQDPRAGEERPTGCSSSADAAPISRATAGRSRTR